jgi:diacylglycerol kinase family enzyme
VSAAGRNLDRPTVPERLAAVGAIVCLLAALVLVVSGAVRNILGLVVSLIGVMAVVVGAWFLVTRRGPIRWAALAVAASGVALAVAGLVIADVRLLVVGAVLVLLALSSGLARFALRRTRQALRAAAPSRAAAAPPAQRPVLLMNPKSGGGKAERFHLVDECRRREIEPVVLSPGDDLLQLARDAIARGADVIGMAGGDGSQALVASVAAEHDVPHVVVPAGTRNHFALDLGLDREDVVGALDAFVDGWERRVDLATVNGRVFVNNASLGLYAKIVQSPEYRDGKLKTTLSILPDMLGPDARPFDLRFAGPSGEHHDSSHMILVSNDPYQLVKPEGRGTRERMDLGVLGMLSVVVSSAADVQALVALDALGQLRRFPGWLEWSAPRFEIDSSGPVEVGVDGEAMLMDPPLVFESRPGALRVRIPTHAPGMSPAARRVTPRELADVALGRPGLRR